MPKNCGPVGDSARKNDRTVSNIQLLLNREYGYSCFRFPRCAVEEISFLSDTVPKIQHKMNGERFYCLAENEN